MAKKLNTKAVNKMKSLVKSGTIDFDSSWSFTAADGNKLLGPDEDNWDRFGSVHLGIDESAEKNTRGYWSLPVAKMKGDTLTVFRRGVIAAKTAAAGGRGAEKNEKIMNAADDLLQMIDEKMDKKKKKGEDSVQRYDFFDIPVFEVGGMEMPFKKTDEGFLAGRPIVTNIGVFPYLQQDGSVRFELRHPDDVLDRASLNTLKMKPVTNDHPMDEVNVGNVRDFQVGSLGDDIFNDSYHVSIGMVVNDEDAIEDILRGKRGLSCGYFARIEDESGVFLGMPYDVRQRDIGYNHVAVVDRGRAGDAARIKLDNIDKRTAYYIVGKKFKEDSNMNLKKIVLDGMEYQAEEAVIKMLNKYKKDCGELQTKLDDATTKAEKLQAEKDSLAEKNDQLGKELEDAKNDSSKIDEAVKERLGILHNADRAGVEVKDEMSPGDIKKAIILSVFPKADLEDRTDVYIDARYDAAVEDIDSKNDADVRETFGNNVLDGSADADDSDSEKAREKMIEYNKKKSRGQKEDK